MFKDKRKKKKPSKSQRDKLKLIHADAFNEGFKMGYLLAKEEKKNGKITG
jgi:hypothetical protein